MNSSAIVFINEVVTIIIMPKEFKSFAEFGQAVNQDKIQQLKQKTDDIFEKSIRDDFESIPEGSFKSSLPEISWIAFARPKNSPESINVTIFSKNESEKGQHHTWRVSRGGEIKPIQPIPPELSKKIPSRRNCS